MSESEQLQAVVLKKFREKSSSAETLDVNTDFAHLGLDSFQITELVTDLETALKVDIDLGALFEYRDISSFCNYLTTTFPAESSDYVRSLAQ